MIPISYLTSGVMTVSKTFREQRGSGQPLVFVLNLTYRCNLRCKHCYSAVPSGGRELDTDDLRRAVQDMRDLGTSIAMLSGGEPLLRSDVYDIIFEVKRHNIKCALSTNGILIDERTCGDLRDLGVDYVGVSLDHVDPRAHDEFRGVRGAWERALQAIKLLVKHGIPTGIRVTITRMNVSSIAKIIDLARVLGVARVACYHLVPSGRGKLISELSLDPAQHLRLLDDLIRYCRAVRDVEVLTVDNPSDGLYVLLRTSDSEEDFWDRVKQLEIRGRCAAARRILSIYPDGVVHPCQFMNTVRMGSIEERRLIDIARDPESKSVVERIRSGQVCNGCAFTRYCGGCRVRADHYVGDVFSIDPECAMIRLRDLHRVGLVDLKPWQIKILSLLPK